MKKIALWMFLTILISCQNQPENKENGNYVPVTPALTSDIMTPEVLWSFGRIGE
jgi:hypothetical protein